MWREGWLVEKKLFVLDFSFEISSKYWQISSCKLLFPSQYNSLKIKPSCSRRLIDAQPPQDVLDPPCSEAIIPVYLMTDSPRRLSFLKLINLDRMYFSRPYPSQKTHIKNHTRLKPFCRAISKFRTVYSIFKPLRLSTLSLFVWAPAICNFLSLLSRTSISPSVFHVKNGDLFI